MIDPTNFLPNNDEWKISKNRIFKKKVAWIPIIDIKESHVNVFLDAKMAREIIKLIPRINCEFYLISPQMADPRISNGLPEEIHLLNINNCFSNYIREVFFDGFPKIGFDMISNMVKYCKYNNCSDLIKICYDDVGVEIRKKEYDPYKNTYSNKYRTDIIEDYNTLYRQIQLSQVLL